MILKLFTETFTSFFNMIQGIIIALLPAILLICLLFVMVHAYTDLKILFNVQSFMDFFKK